MSTVVKNGTNIGEAKVTTEGKLQVVTETSPLINPNNVGAVTLFTQNDDGTKTGTQYIKSPETSPDFRLRVGQDSLLFEDTFNATIQNTSNWSYTFATLTASQPGAGTVNFGTVQGTTNAHGAMMRTFQYQPLIATAPINAEFLCGSAIAPMVVGEEWLMGIGLPASAILPPTDGVYYRITSGGIYGVLRYNNAVTEVLFTATQPVDGIFNKYTIVIGESECEFWVEDILLGEISIPSGNGVPFLGGSAPLFMQKYNTGTISNTNQWRVTRVTATLGDIDTTRTWGTAQSLIGKHATNGQNGQTVGSTAGNYAGAAAIPATQAGSNTTPNVGMAGLGGVFQMTVQAGSLLASGDMVASYFLNPVPSVNITGRNLIITKCKINAVNMGAVVAGTPTTLLWGLNYGNTAVSLATAESASFTTATAKAPRKVALGINYVPIGAVIGQPYSNEVGEDFTIAPICVRPGEYIGTTVRFLVGTATASQTVIYTIVFGGYWE